MRSCVHPIAVLALLLILLTSPPSNAQPLANRVPDDAILYVGWQGAAHIEGYDQTHLKAVLDAWQPLSQLNAAIAPLIDREGGPDEQLAWRTFQELAPVLYRRPWAIYAGAVGGEERLAIICAAGDDAAGLRAALQPLITLAGGKEPAPRLEQQGDDVAFLVGRWPEAHVNRMLSRGREDERVPPLNQAKEFTVAAKTVGIDSPAAAVYFNISALMQVEGFGRLMQQQGAAQLRDVVGLDGIHRLYWAGGFDGADWQTASWVEASAPRRGVAALLAAPALEQQVIAAAPRTATWLIAARFDLNKAWQLIREMVSASDQQAMENLNQKLSHFEQQIGVDIEQDVLEPLGDQWLTYGDPSIPMSFIPGAMVMNFARDGKALDASLTKLMHAANMMIAGEQQPEGRPRLAVQQIQADGATIHSMGVPLFSPGVAVHDGELYFALSPQTIAMKIAMTQMQVTPITRSPEWKQVMQKLGDHPSQAVVFIDLKQTAPLMLQGATNLAQKMQMQAPPGVNMVKLVPNLATLMPHLGPVGLVAWSDDSGIHSRSRSPFPFSATLSPVGGSIPTTVGLLTGMLVPSLNRARDVARIAKSQAQLKQIGVAVHIWANGHEEQLPPDLHTLVKAQLIEPRTLLNPRLGEPDVAPDGLAAEQLEAWIRDNSGYIYIGGGKKFREMPMGTANTPIAHERLSPELGDKVNVLFADGHVETMPIEQAKQKLHEAGVQTP